jgi:hypothetical protein
MCKYTSRIAEYVPNFSVKGEGGTVKYGMPHNSVRALHLNLTLLYSLPLKEVIYSKCWELEHPILLRIQGVLPRQSPRN